MGNLLKTGSDWLEAQRHAHAAGPVVYRRGSESVSLRATVGRTAFDVLDEEGFARRIVQRDYLVRSQDLVLAGERTLPQPGDEVLETDDEGNTLVHEVVAQGGEDCWRYSDPHDKTIRIHTQRIRTEEP